MSQYSLHFAFLKPSTVSFQRDSYFCSFFSAASNSFKNIYKSRSKSFLNYSSMRLRSSKAVFCLYVFID